MSDLKEFTGQKHKCHPVGTVMVRKMLFGLIPITVKRSQGNARAWRESTK